MELTDADMKHEKNRKKIKKLLRHRLETKGLVTGSEKTVIELQQEKDGFRVYVSKITPLVWVGIEIRQRYMELSRTRNSLSEGQPSRKAIIAAGNVAVHGLNIQADHAIFVQGLWQDQGGDRLFHALYEVRVNDYEPDEEGESESD